MNHLYRFLQSISRAISDVWDSANHRLNISLNGGISGEDTVQNVLRVEQQFTNLGIATADTLIKNGAGFLHLITIGAVTGTPTAGLLTIYDSATETGTILYRGWVFATQPGVGIPIDKAFTTGCYVGFDATLTNVAVTVSGR